MNLIKHWAATLDDYVIDLAWSPDGTLLATASAAGPVSLFSTADGVKRHELPGHDNGTNCLAWQPVGRVIPNAPGSSSEPERRVKDNPPCLLATGGQDGAVKFWDAAAGQHTATAKLGAAWVEHLAWQPVAGLVDPGPGSTSPATLLASVGKNLVALRPDASVAHTFKPAPKTITALAWQPVRKPEAGEQRTEAGSSAPSSAPVAAVACFGEVSLWDANNFIPQKTFPYANGIHALVWSPDGKWLVSGNQDPSVHLWIPEQDAELHMSGYESKVKYLSFDHTSRWLATGGGRDACIWDCSGAGPEGREPAMLPHDAPVCAVAFQNTHGLLATASQDGVVMLWSPERKQPLRATVKMPAAATKLAWSPDDRYLAIGSEKGAVYVLKAD
jgi:WD40 repeat protein